MSDLALFSILYAIIVGIGIIAVTLVLYVEHRTQGNYRAVKERE